MYTMSMTIHCVQEVQNGKSTALTLWFPASSLYPKPINNGLSFIHSLTHSFTSRVYEVIEAHRLYCHQAFAGKKIHRTKAVIWIRPTCLICCGRSSQVRLANLCPTLPLHKWGAASRVVLPCVAPGPGHGPVAVRALTDGKRSEAVDLHLTSSDTEYPSSWPHWGPLQKLPFTDTVVHGQWLANPKHLGEGERVWVSVDVWSPNLTVFFLFYFFIFLFF